MGTDTINILIADDNPEISDILNNFLKLYDDITVCGIAKTGAQALKMIYELSPDVVLLDIIMPELDGISILEGLKEDPPIKVPSIIIVSAVGQEKIAHEAFELGACYYIIKPFNLNALLNRVRIIAKNDASQIKQHSFSDNSLINNIKKTIIEVGISTNVLGYKYIAESLCAMCGSEEPISLNKGVYAHVAGKFNTTIECVEKAIRSAITSAHKKKTKYYIQLFCTQDKKVESSIKCGNSKFLTTLCENIKFVQ